MSPVPNWLSEPTEKWSPDQKICLLDNFAGASDLSGFKPEDFTVFYYDKPSYWLEEDDGYFNMVLHRKCHPALGRWYMTKKDDPNAHRRHSVWIGFDITPSRIGFDKLPVGLQGSGSDILKVLLRRLASDAMAENIYAQDTIPMLDGPKRAFWMELYGYFGNLYEDEGRKGILKAAKMHLQLLNALREKAYLRMFWDPGYGRNPVDLAFVKNSANHFADERDHECLYGKFVLSKPQALIFPGFAMKPYASLNGDSKKGSSDCIIV